MCYEECLLHSDRDSPFSSLQTWMHRVWGKRSQVSSGEHSESQKPCSGAWQVTHSTGPSLGLAFFAVRSQVSHQAGQPSTFPIPSCACCPHCTQSFPFWSDSLKGDNSTQMAGDTAGGATLALAGLANVLGSELTGPTWASWKVPVWTFRKEGG